MESYSAVRVLPSKVLVVVLCGAIPLGFLVAAWMAFGGPNSDERVQRLALGLGIAFVTTLVAVRAYDSCSVSLDDSGVEHVKLLAGGTFFAKRRLRWDEVVEVTAESNAYMLKGATFAVPVRPMVFSEPGRVVAYLRDHLAPPLVRKAFGSPDK